MASLVKNYTAFSIEKSKDMRSLLFLFTTSTLYCFWHIIRNSNIDGFELNSGAVVIIKFVNNNTASDAQLNINDLGSYQIVGGDGILANNVYQFVLDNDCFRIVGSNSSTSDNVSNSTHNVRETWFSIDGTIPSGGIPFVVS